MTCVSIAQSVATESDTSALTLTETCNSIASGPCPYGHWCISYTCLPSEKGLQVNQPLCGRTSSNGVSECPAGLECRHNDPGGRCQVKRGKMILCARDWHCDWHERCSDGRCVPGPVRNRPQCRGNEDCWFGHYCLEKKCEKQPYWEPTWCSHTRECSRGKVCHANICVTRESVFVDHIDSELCHSDRQCFSYRSCNQGVCVGVNFRVMPCKPVNRFDPIQCTVLERYDCRGFPVDRKLYVTCRSNDRILSGATRPCVVDEDCPITQICHGNQTEGFKCQEFFPIYVKNQCSWDGHCFTGRCILSNDNTTGTCGEDPSRPERKTCTRKDDCEEYHVCSFGRCTYPRRKMQDGEPLPCLADAECPSKRICYRNGCVPRFSIPRGRCSDNEQCRFSGLNEHICFDGFCVRKRLVAYTEVTRKNYENITTVLHQPELLGSDSSLGFPSSACDNDLDCLFGELCVRKIVGSTSRRECVFQEARRYCDSEPCPNEAEICYLGRCIAILK